MNEKTMKWEAKVWFFSKFLGYQADDFEETLEEVPKIEMTKRHSKGIEVVQNPLLYQSLTYSNEHNQELQSQWLNLIRTPYRRSTKSQLLKLTYQGTCYAHKVIPWLAQNKQKINLKLFNMKRMQYRTCVNINNPFKLEKMNSQLQIMKLKIVSNQLSQLLGIFMLYRQDIQYSQTLMLLGQTVNEYLIDAPIMAFNLLYVLCCSEVFLPILTNQVQSIDYIVNQISINLKTNCSSVLFLTWDKIPVEEFIRTMISCVWVNISERKSSFRQKILYYLLINQMSFKAISRVCEAAIYGLSKFLNQQSRQKIISALNTPQIILDEDIFLNYLFFDK